MYKILILVTNEEIIKEAHNTTIPMETVILSPYLLQQNVLIGEKKYRPVVARVLIHAETPRNIFNGPIHTRDEHIVLANKSSSKTTNLQFVFLKVRVFCSPRRYVRLQCELGH